MDDITAQLKTLSISPLVEGEPHHYLLPALDLICTRTEAHISYEAPHDNEAWIRRRLVKEKAPVLFVGESCDRSLPTAFAQIHGSWDDIWASSAEKNFHIRTLSALLVGVEQRSARNVQFLLDTSQSLQYSQIWGITYRITAGNLRLGYDEIIHTDPVWQTQVTAIRQELSEATKTLNRKSERIVLNRLALVVDACNLKQSLASRDLVGIVPNGVRLTQNIWFQCPWRQYPGSTATLIQECIKSPAAVQKCGDPIFLGLTAHSRYSHRYGIEDMKDLARRLGYEIFIDESFMRCAIDAGYKHESVTGQDIHDLILDYHQTFVFVKR
jgi:hypothetical protein